MIDENERKALPYRPTLAELGYSPEACQIRHYHIRALLHGAVSRKIRPGSYNWRGTWQTHPRVNINQTVKKLLALELVTIREDDNACYAVINRKGAMVLQELGVLDRIEEKYNA